MDDKNTMAEYHYTDIYGDTFVVRPELSMYRDTNNLFLRLLSFDEDLEDFDDYCVLTVDIKPMSYLQNTLDLRMGTKAKEQFLLENNLGRFTGEYVYSGYEQFPVFEFHEDVLKHFDPKLFAEYQKHFGINTKKESIDEKITKALKRTENSLKKESVMPELDHEL